MNTLSNEEIYALLSKKVNSISTGGGSSVESESDIVTVHFTYDDEHSQNYAIFTCDKTEKEISNLIESGKTIIGVDNSKEPYQCFICGGIITFISFIFNGDDLNPSMYNSLGIRYIIRDKNVADGWAQILSGAFKNNIVSAYSNTLDSYSLNCMNLFIKNDTICTLLYRSGREIKMANYAFQNDSSYVFISFKNDSSNALVIEEWFVNKETGKIVQEAVEIVISSDLLEYQHEMITATETMGQITVQSFTTNAVNSILSILNDYPNKTIEVKLTSSTFSNTTMILELTQYTDTEVHFTGDCFINGKFVFMDLKVDSTDAWTFTSKQYTEVS